MFWVREAAQYVEHLIPEHEDQSLVPSTYVKTTWVWQLACSPSTSQMKQGIQNSQNGELWAQQEERT